MCGFAPEQFIAGLFIGRKLRFPGHDIVVLRREWSHLWRTLEGRDRFGDSIKRSLRSSPVDGCEMKWKRICSWRWTWTVANLLYIRRPFDREGLRAPKLFRHGTIRPLGHSIHHTGWVDQAHLCGVQRRTLCLLGERAVQAQPCGAHVPELTADKITLFRIVVENW